MRVKSVFVLTLALMGCSSESEEDACVRKNLEAFDVKSEKISPLISRNVAEARIRALCRRAPGARASPGFSFD